MNIKKLFNKTFRNSRNRIGYSGTTDTGRVRSHNEDNYGIFADRNVFAVADGMGGHNAGEVASKIAIETLDAHFSKNALKKIRKNREEIQHFLVNGFQHINNVVITSARKNDARSGMGCTLVTCLIDNGRLHTCHVGDARCYIADRHKIRQLTNDHSMIAHYEQNTKENDTIALTRPARQVITRAIGFPFSEDAEYHCEMIHPGDRILLCSDGLWSLLDDNRILELLFSSESPEDVSQLLVQKANDAGGTDNITAVVIFC